MKSCPRCQRRFPDTVQQCPDDASWLQPISEPALPGSQYLGRELAGRYRLDVRLGSGSVGVVFKGVDLHTDIEVAVKLLMPHGFVEPRASRRLKREFRALKGLENPHIVQAYDLAQTKEGVPFLVMELVRGHDLAYVLDQEGRLSPPRSLRIIIQILEALQAAHDHGVIHRDLKPENIHLTVEKEDPEFVKVLDFGLAKFFDMGHGQPTELTAHNLVVGTPHYMAPEQIRGNKLGPHTDLYAVGVLLYRMLSGQLPFPGNEPLQVMEAHCRQDPISPRFHAPAIPPALEALTLELLEKDPSFRPRSADSLRARLQAGELGALMEEVAWSGTANDLPPGDARPAYAGSAALRAPAHPSWQEAPSPPAGASLSAIASSRGTPILEPSVSALPPAPRPIPLAGEEQEPSYLWLVALVWGIALLTAFAVMFILL